MKKIDVPQSKSIVRSFLDWTFEGRSAKWLYVVGFAFLVLFTHYGGALFSPLTALLGDTSTWPKLATYAIPAVMLIPIVVMPLLWVRLAHKRPWWSIAFPELRLEAWNLGIGVFVALIVTVASWIFFATVLDVPISFGVPDLATYVPIFIVMIVLVFMQTTVEELVFRGYGMQAVRRFTASPVAMIVVTALVFALPHYPNVLRNGWPWWGLISYAAPAVLFAWMVLRTGSLWMPMGWHWLNNFTLSQVISVDKGTASGPAAGTAIMYADSRPSLAMTLAVQVVGFMLAAVIINYLVGRREAVQRNRDSQRTA